MAANVISAEFTTISITNGAGGDTIQTRGRHVWCKNLGANQVSISDSTTIPTGAATAGNQTTLNPLPTTGTADGVLLRPGKLYSLRANTGATLISCEEVNTPTEFSAAD
jgi:hypothetical protein